MSDLWQQTLLCPPFRVRREVLSWFGKDLCLEAGCQEPLEIEVRTESFLFPVVGT